MADRVSLDREQLGRLMAIVQELGVGEDLDDILQHVAAAVVDVIGFDAVAVNVVTRSGDLEVRTVVGPPELETLLGGALPQDGWLALLDASEQWGELRFCRSPVLDDSVPHVDPRPDRLSTPAVSPVGLDVEPWQPEFALLVPLWRAPRELLGVISVDLPRTGLTPDFQQRALLELFGTQAAAAIARVHAFDLASGKASLYRAAFVASPAPTLVLDAHLFVTDVNAAFLDLAEALEDEVLGRTLADLVILPGSDIEQTTALDALGVNESTILAEECALRHPRGHAWDRWVQVTARRVDDATTGPNYVCLVGDRTAVRQRMDELRKRAERDDLTGLYLRAAGMNELAARCQPAAADTADPDVHDPAVTQAVLYCDLDGFKQVNDADGHRAGDEVLAAVARCLTAAAEPSDILCRWGGDEFVLIASRTTMGEIVDLANELVSAVRTLAAAAPPGEPVRALGVSVGIAEFTPPADPTAVLEAADAALYRAKTDAHQRVHVHAPLP
ncbi:sensor domain-containing diguanylate cyclase [Mycobacterium yunnanensis]|uniref:Sensor domain-containing diguanylate cyclase n=1 Tax=Mycobacterium yunnanensis TaxID=368477 RepID=A0A9X2Z083_9MYCO|nr:GGDEF domain-containing protein [Mycobacterium yunnanensis]MCV7420579.1 sensor domain-containing diguanylate cyclase [Mycobacterium yunnanensis]